MKVPLYLITECWSIAQWKTGKKERWYKLRLCYPIARNERYETSSGLTSTKQDTNVGRVWCEDRKSVGSENRRRSKLLLVLLKLGSIRREDVVTERFFRAEKWRRCNLLLHHSAHLTPASLHDAHPAKHTTPHVSLHKQMCRRATL